MFKILEKVHAAMLVLIGDSLLFKLVGKTLIIVALLFSINFFSKNLSPTATTLLNTILGIFIRELWTSLQDCFDTTNWKKSQRKLQRGGFLSRNSLVRISFAYLYRIKIGREYFLIKNDRGTGKYQPIGGVYKFDEEEKKTLKDIFHVIDDNKISIDDSSRNDYRLRLQNKYLRKFIKHFDKTTHRENISNLSRELKEEVLNKLNELEIAPWKTIKYRFCGRHIADIKFSNHFQMYELLLADIVELILSPEQEDALKKLCSKHHDTYRLELAEKIYSFGINTMVQDLKETIADHTKKILEEEQGKLIAIKSYQGEYTINI